MRVVVTLAERPALPEGWIILNAARPIVGTDTWEENFLSGAHWAAIDPTDGDAAEMLRVAEESEAVVVAYLSRDAVTQLAEARRTAIVASLGRRASMRSGGDAMMCAALRKPLPDSHIFETAHMIQDALQP